MKKKIKLGIALVLVSIVGYLGYSIVQKVNYKTAVAERIKTLPQFSFLTLENETFTDRKISTTKNKLFVYFNSECDFCQHETQQISEHIQEFKDTQIIFVSFEEIETIKSFANNYNLLDKENVLFLHDKQLQFADIFDAKSIPYMILYSKDNELLQKFKGATKIEKILDYIN